MMKYPRSITWTLPALVCVLVVCWQCTRPELIGADLLENEAAQVVFTDTLSLECSHVLPSPLLTYSSESGSRLIRNMVGHLNDPYFGETEASFYTQLFLLTGSSAFLGKGINAIDSVVIAMTYDTLGFYGDDSQPLTISVYRLIEDLNADGEYYTDRQPMVESQPILTQTVLPLPNDSLYIQSRGDSVRVPPMMRLTMTQETSLQFLTDLIAQDSSTFEAADSFKLWMKGLYFQATMADNHMVGLDLDDLYSKVTIYYKNVGDTISSEVGFIFSELVGSGIHHQYVNHTREGSELQKFLDNPDLADSLLFIQGMAGVDVGIKLPGLPELQDIMINKAELEFYIAEIPDDNLDFYPPVIQLVNGVKDEDGQPMLSEDVQIVIDRFGVLDPFGGDMMTDSSNVRPIKYAMNVTTSLQDIQKGKTENLFFITPFISVNVPRRVILYGPGSSEFPARLRLTYTKVQ